MNVLDVLRNGSDQEAAETLVRLRLGQTVEEASRESASARARRRAQDATPDTASVADSSQKSGTGSRRHDSHVCGRSTSVSGSAASPNTLHTPRSVTTELRSPLHAESDRMRLQVSASDTQFASWSFSNTPDTELSPSNWNSTTMHESEQSHFLMDGIFAQCDFGGSDGNGDGNAPAPWDIHSIFDM